MPDSRGRSVRALARAAAFPALLHSLAAHASPCRPETGYSSCIDANALWPSPGEQRFFSIASPSATKYGRLSFGVQAQALVRPLVLEVPAPTEGLREVRLVEYAIDETLLFDAGLGRGLSVGAAFAVALYQRGAGIEGITSQNGAALESTVNRDPRLRIAYTRALTDGIAVQPRFELTVPLGEKESFAGAGALTAAPGLALQTITTRLHFGLDASVRLRPSVELGTGRWGSQLATAAGASLDVLGGGRLFVSGELFALFPLVESTSERGRRVGIETTWIPAEWLLSVGGRPDALSPWAVIVGAGSGLALSSDELGGARRTFVGPTSPQFRGLLTIRYAPVEAKR